MSHGECTGIFETGQETVNKVRGMGFSQQFMPMPLQITCTGCNNSFQMNTFEDKCPHCGMVHGVTPCHAFDPSNVQAAGIDY
ncbi:MAG: hypothetical protein B6I28_01785 [Fusobacteriia bacterium 4572_132]|nr:MAG: hypothetical protein B6I28_01785 [Fusobacteriia bacterium 4572_132]